jgi:hypothetical protein
MYEAWVGLFERRISSQVIWQSQDMAQQRCSLHLEEPGRATGILKWLQPLNAASAAVQKWCAVKPAVCRWQPTWLMSAIKSRVVTSIAIIAISDEQDEVWHCEMICLRQKGFL